MADELKKYVQFRTNNEVGLFLSCVAIGPIKGLVVYTYYIYCCRKRLSSYFRWTISNNNNSQPAERSTFANIAAILIIVTSFNNQDRSG